MTRKKLVVIGAGSGGVRLARRMAAHDWDVTVFEESALGGTCVNRGCVPKKLYVYAAEFKEFASEAPSYGWAGVEAGVCDLAILSCRVNQEIARLNGIYSDLLEKAGVKVVRQRAQFAKTDRITCQGQEYPFDVAVIATGGTPKALPVSGGSHCIDSDSFFSLTDLPKSAIVLGGGYIALELSSILQGLGCQTRILHRSERFLRGFDSALVARLIEQLKHRGLEFVTGCQVKSIEGSAKEKRVICEDQDYTADLVVSAIGRIPYTGGLGLDKGHIKSDDKGQIAVDKNYRTSNDKIYAIGDVIGGQQLTPVAIAEAERLVWLLNREHSGEGSTDALRDEWQPHHVPSAVFTAPELASVGLDEDQVAAAGTDVRIYESEFRALRQMLFSTGEKTSIKLICNQQDNILGLHMLGHGSSEIVQSMTPLVRRGANKSELDQTIGIHPSVGEELFVLRNYRRL